MVRRCYRVVPMADALVVFPGHGSIWLSDVETVDGYVVGTVPLYPGQTEPPDVINVPLSCVMRWEPPKQGRGSRLGRGEGGASP